MLFNRRGTLILQCSQWLDSLHTVVIAKIVTIISLNQIIELSKELLLSKKKPKIISQEGFFNFTISYWSGHMTIRNRKFLLTVTEIQCYKSTMLFLHFFLRKTFQIDYFSNLNSISSLFKSIKVADLCQLCHKHKVNSCSQTYT